MNAGFNNHVSEEVLETYALGKLSEEDCAPLEEHLLLCCICQRRLEQTDEYLRVIQAAAWSPGHGPAAGIRRFVPEFRIPATIPGTALLFPHASALAILDSVLRLWRPWDASARLQPGRGTVSPDWDS